MLTEFLYTPLGLLVCLCIVFVFVWAAIRFRDADWLVIIGMCALTMLGGSKWASEKLRRKRSGK